MIGPTSCNVNAVQQSGKFRDPCTLARHASLALEGFCEANDEKATTLRHCWFVLIESRRMSKQLTIGDFFNKTPGKVGSCHHTQSPRSRSKSIKFAIDMHVP
jgi:hypothetical protein